MTNPVRVMSNEVVGTFIDAVYAIAITLLALELPDQFEPDAAWSASFATLLEYAVAFALLFVFWIDHRGINAHIERYDRRLLAVTGLALFLVCLIPTATLLVFQYGDDVTLASFAQSLLQGAQLSRAEVVDLFFLVSVLATDGALLITSRLGIRHDGSDLAASVRRAKATASLLLFAAAGVSLLLPIENRYFTLILPAAAFFQEELSRLFRRAATRPA